MIFLILLLITCFIIVLVLGIKAADKDDSIDKVCKDNTNSFDTSSYSYPDTYTLTPDKAIYLDKDEELLEDV